MVSRTIGPTTSLHIGRIPTVLRALGDFLQAEREATAAYEPLQLAASLLGRVFDDIQTRYQRRQKTGKDAIGHSTGFPRLDRILGGLDRGRMSIMLAAPGAGKTTLSNQLRPAYPDTYPIVVVDFLQRLATSAGDTSRGAGLDDMRGRVGLISQQLRTLASHRLS